MKKLLYFVVTMFHRILENKTTTQLSSRIVWEIKEKKKDVSHFVKGCIFCGGKFENCGVYSGTMNNTSEIRYYTQFECKTYGWLKKE